MAAVNNNSSASESQEIKRLVTEACEQGKPDRYGGKRRWMRFTAGMRLEITSNPADPSASSPVVMQNVSEGGVSLWSKRECRPHSTIYIREYSGDEDREWLPAQVRHCTFGIRGYLVGAEFDGCGANPTT